jgi:uncharacterized protein YndB with AHSA1/START domain
MPSRVLVAMRVKVTPERAFEAFTREIAAWWRPSGLFEFTPQDTGALRFEPGVGGRFLMGQSDGAEFEIGRIQRWDPPAELVFTWRQQSFTPQQCTTVSVRFEPMGDETRVTVEHAGWDGIPRPHAARHGLPLDVFQLRHAEWWQILLTALHARAKEGGDHPTTP